MNNEFESCLIELINGRQPIITIGVFYRHPSKTDTTFNIELKSILHKIKKERKKTIVCGDLTTAY